MANTTEMMNVNTMSAFMNEVRKYKQLDKETERELAYRTQRGDLKARNELVMCNIPLCLNIVKQWKNDKITVEELLGPAMEGLIKGIDKFDPEKGRLSNYVAMYIHNEVRNYVCAMGDACAITENEGKKLTKMRTSKDLLEQATGGAVDSKALWDYMRENDKGFSKMSYTDFCHLFDFGKWSSADVNERVESSRHSEKEEVACDCEGAESDECTYGDTIADTDSSEEENCTDDADDSGSSEDDEEQIFVCETLVDVATTDMNSVVLGKILDELQERTQFVLTHMFGIGCDKMQVKEIARSLGISQEAVRKHKVKGFEYIKERFPQLMEAA